MAWADEGSRSIDRDDAVAAINACILGVCLAAGLARPDADDVVQDVWEWVLRSGTLASAAAAPWIAAVTRNFVMRSRRRSNRQRYREGVALEMVPEPQAAVDGSMLDSNEVLDTLASILPQKERNLLILVRKGHSLAHAAELLGIPRGSRAYYSGRLVRIARRAIRGRRLGPTTPHPDPLPRARDTSASLVRRRRMDRTGSRRARGEGMDAAQAPPGPAQPDAGVDFVAKLDAGISEARDLLSSLEDPEALAPWRMTYAGREIFAIPRIQMLRTMLFNHWYHHRGQLAVYLRLLDVPVPAIYGRSADETPWAPKEKEPERAAAPRSEP